MANLIFMGTSEFACCSLAAIEKAGCLPTLVITREDSLSGRKRQPVGSPVKVWAEARGLPLWQPKNINSLESVEKFKSLKPDLLVVVAYGRILGKAVLSIPSLGAINVHASLLPDLRGAAPVEWAIMLGYTETGITTMFMDEGLDTGDIILQQALPIGARENSGQLRQRLAIAAQPLLLTTIDLVLQGKAPRRPQPALCPNYAPPIDSACERLDWSLSAPELANRVRGLAPKPGSYCQFRDRRLKIYEAVACPGKAPPGRLIVQKRKLYVGTGGGLLALLALQPEGKGLLAAADFINGYRVQEGEYCQ